MTDRALRYRANAHPPLGAKICCFCGSRSDIQIAHIDGEEAHNEPANLAWSCRSCNGRMAHTFKRAGIGRRTRQFNPSTSGAANLAQWLTAVTSMKGQNNAMSVSDAVAIIHATPPARRSEFARQIWALRRERGTDRPSDEVPF